MAHWIYKDDLDALPVLPYRIVVNEVKDFGMVKLIHRDYQPYEPWRYREPWLPADHYKTMINGRIYVVETEITQKGNPVPAWLYRPHVRVRGRSR